MASQVKPKYTIPIDNSALMKNNETAVYWLTSAGILVNSHGVTLIMDPNISYMHDDPFLSEVQDLGNPAEPFLRVLCQPPILGLDIKKLDAVLITHADTDHLGRKSVIDLIPSGCMYHGTNYVCNELLELGIPNNRILAHNIGDEFLIGEIRIKLTPAYHPWQRCQPEKFNYIYTIDDCCGYKLYTRDGIIWNPGDSLLLNDHFEQTDVDLVTLDFSDDDSICHFGRSNAILLANHLIFSDILIYHWGSFEGKDLAWCNCNPEDVRAHIINNNRFLSLNPGEKYVLRKKQ